jgi:DNA (cytosine-5)-methyltransferase 1
MPTAVSLFSGAGGMDLGFKSAGFEIVWANDSDKYACQTYSANIGDEIVHGPLEEIDPTRIPDADVIFGGPPCQGFSVAGKMDAHDPRSQLIWSFLEIVALKRPLYFVMENVPGLAKLSKFSRVRGALYHEYQKLGYRIAVRILNSSDYDVPQNRHRMIMIGTRDDGEGIRFPRPTGRTITARDVLTTMDPPGEGNNTGLCKAKITIAQFPVLRRSPYAGMLFNGLGRPIDLDRPSQTLPASMGGNKTPILEENLLRSKRGKSWVVKHHAFVSREEEFDAYAIKVPRYLRRLTVRECARIQGFPDEFQFVGTTSQQFRQIGNAVPPPLAHHVGRSVVDALEGNASELQQTELQLQLQRAD